MSFGSLSVVAGILPVPVLFQTQNQWCWAASSQMILSYYGTITAQCTMANYCFGLSYCCASPSSSSCNQPNWIYGYGKDMAEVLSHYGGISGSGYEKALGWSTLVSEINGGHPFVIGFSWTEGGGHALVGRGYSGSYGYYNDPWPGNGYSWNLYSWMVSASDHVWDQSYTTRLSYPVLAGGDYNGDGNDDIAIFRPSSGLWSVRGVGRAYWGGSGDIPVPGDYAGQGTTSIGIFRPSTGLWAISGFNRFYFGSSSDIPVPADYTGNGKCNYMIFRPSSGLWASGSYRIYFGGSSDIPVPGDYNGNGTATPAIFRDSSGLWAIRGDPVRVYFGGSGDIPVPGDYTNQGDWNAGIYRPSSGLWALAGMTRCYFGGPSDQPIPADFDQYWGDDIATFRASSGLWAIKGYTRCYYGGSGDIPVTR